MEFETLRKDNRKKWLIGTVVVLIIASVVFFVSTRANYKAEQRLNLINKTVNYSISDLDVMAINVQNSSEGYDMVDTVPTSGYTLSDKSYCEVNGNKDTSIPIEYKDGKVEIGISKKGTKCYLFFDTKKTASATLIAKNEMINENGYRYEGKTPNNYVKFNDELWRIIGVFEVTNADTNETESLVKLIRNESIGNMKLDTGYNEYWEGFSIVSNLEAISANYPDMIQNVNWPVGYNWTNDTDKIENIISDSYSSILKSNIGLMSLVDYLYASNKEVCPRNTVLSEYSCSTENWLYNGTNQWTNSFIGLYSHEPCVNYINYMGNISFASAYGAEYGVRPVVYLKSNVSIVDNGKDGSSTNPYDLVLN